MTPFLPAAHPHLRRRRSVRQQQREEGEHEGVEQQGEPKGEELGGRRHRHATERASYADEDEGVEGVVGDLQGMGGGGGTRWRSLEIHAHTKA